MGLTPSLNRVVRRSKAAIWTQVGRRCNRAGRRGGMHHLPVLGKRSEQLDAHFEPNAAIPVDGDVAAASRLLRSHGIPNQATTLWYDTRKFGCAHLAPDDGERDTLARLDLDDVWRHRWALYTISMLKMYPLWGLSRPFHPG